jgi:hypothetical protein
VDEIEEVTEQHMNFWQSFRQSATPIFEWIYNYSQRQMEMNMVIDTKELVKQYQDTL